MIVVGRTAQQVELDEAGQRVELAVAIEPDLLEGFEVRQTIGRSGKAA